MFSLYDDILYNLHPVFIGTHDELCELMLKLERWKNDDPLHSHDAFITDWHSETKLTNE